MEEQTMEQQRNAAAEAAWKEFQEAIVTAFANNKWQKNYNFAPLLLAAEKLNRVCPDGRFGSFEILDKLSAMDEKISSTLKKNPAFHEALRAFGGVLQSHNFSPARELYHIFAIMLERVCEGFSLPKGPFKDKVHTFARSRVNDVIAKCMSLSSEFGEACLGELNKITNPALRNVLIREFNQNLSNKIFIDDDLRDVKEFVDLINEGKFADLRRFFNFNALLIDACKKGELDVVRVLTEKTKDFNQVSNWGRTLLMIACENGHANVARFLLENGASVNSQDAMGRTALKFACENGHANLARFLLANRASVDGEDENGRTALMDACENGHVKVARVLLTRDASVDGKDKNGRTALMIACEKGHAEVAEVLLNHGASVDAADKNGRTALMIACEKGHAEVAEVLLNHGASVDVADKNGRTALMYALDAADSKGGLECFQLLHASGAGQDKKHLGLMEIREIKNLEAQKIVEAKYLAIGDFNNPALSVENIRETVSDLNNMHVFAFRQKIAGKPVALSSLFSDLQLWHYGAGQSKKETSAPAPAASPPTVHPGGRRG